MDPVMKEMIKLLELILDEQLEHGEHGDAVYIRDIRAVLDKVVSRETGKEE